jgi:hypothetical protein
MIEKVKLALHGLIPFGSQIKGYSLVIFKALIYVIGLTVMMYLIGCTQVWVQTGKPPLVEIRALIDTLTSPSACAAFLLYATSLIDRDGDGESDFAAKKLEDGNVNAPSVRR